jgi:hypothetical protein
MNNNDVQNVDKQCNILKKKKDAHHTAHIRTNAKCEEATSPK